MDARDQTDWPPANGKAYIQGAEFGNDLVRIAKQLAAHYPRMDFTDAVARVFAWFDGKLKENRRFINKQRFRTKNSFLAYLRQAVWNAARMAERERRRFEPIEALPVDQPIARVVAGPEEHMSLLEMAEMVTKLTNPHRTVFERVFIDEERFSVVAKSLGQSERAIQVLYEEALDMLAKGLGPE